MIVVTQLWKPKLVQSGVFLSRVKVGKFGGYSIQEARPSSIYSWDSKMRPGV
jgi:hypothetical protein